MTEKIKIYDASMDEWRDATQSDLDLLYRLTQEYGAMRRILKTLADAPHNVGAYVALASKLATAIEKQNELAEAAKSV